MPSLNGYFNKASKNPVEEILTKKMHPQNISYKKLEESTFQYRKIPSEDVEKLADLIEIDGEVLQPLLVRKKGADTFEILAGHKRYKACKLLSEERQKKEFAFIPCYVKEMSDAQAEFAVYSTNGYNRKTDYEIMREVEGMSRLVKENPEAFPEAPSGRLVEKLAAIMGMSKTTVQEYKTISNNLTDEAMEKFREGTLSKESAKVLASAPEEKQKEAILNGIVKSSEVKEFVGKSDNVNMPNTAGIYQTFKSLTNYYKKDIDGDLTEWLKKRYGKTYCCCDSKVISYTCTPRGVTIKNSDEITWKTFVKKAEELGFMKFLKSSEPQKKDITDDQDDDDNLPGQMTINDVLDEVSKAPIPEEKEVRPQNAVTYENNIIDQTRAKQLEGIYSMGKCPYCGKGVLYPSNIKYCGACGKQIIWSMDWMSNRK